MKKTTYIIWLMVMVWNIGLCQSSFTSQKLPKNIGAELFKLSENQSLRLSKASNSNYILNKEGQINLSIRRGNNTDTDKAFEKSKIENTLGIKILKMHKNLASFYASVEDLSRLIKIVPDGYFLELSKRPEIANQGPSSINSTTYNIAGVGGTGKKIAVIDIGFSNYTATLATGAVPPESQYQYFDLSPDDPSTSTHGTSCIEMIYDHAPQADYVMYKISGFMDAVDAINDCIIKDVDIISISLTFFNQGYWDNTGIVNEAIIEAANEGIIIFHSTGNQRQRHWEGEFRDENNNGKHEWLGNGEGNYLTIEAGESIAIAMMWASNFNDYELHLRDASTDEIIAVSSQSNNTEYLTYENESSEDKSYYFEAISITNVHPYFEVFIRSYGCSCFPGYNVEWSSGTTNLKHDLVILVGAVDYFLYGSDNPATEDYSGLGPTNSHNFAPHISGPTNTTSFAKGGPFGGTSCATPNAAGAALAFWSAHPFYSAKGIVDIIFRKAELVKDWGSTGIDYYYGYGGINLYDYGADHQYATKFSENFDPMLDLPWNDIWYANIYAPLGSKIIFLGEDYTEEEQEGLSHIIDWKMTYKSFHKNTVIR